MAVVVAVTVVDVFVVAVVGALAVDILLVLLLLLSVILLLLLLLPVLLLLYLLVFSDDIATTAGVGAACCSPFSMQVLAVLSGVAQSAYKMCGDVRLLANLKEVEEPFAKTQARARSLTFY